MAFTSDLSGQEFWLVVDKGYTPLGLVLGNSVYSMGVMGSLLSTLKGTFKGEVEEMTQLMYDAREKALHRMKQEAVQLGADGVVAVKMEIKELNAGQWMEVTAIGTAIKYNGNPQGPATGRGTVVINT